MLDGADLDLVVNLTPIPFHGATSRTILEAGKHLVVEKPIATTMEDADLLVELANARGLKVVVAPPAVGVKSAAGINLKARAGMGRRPTIVQAPVKRPAASAPVVRGGVRGHVGSKIEPPKKGIAVKGGAGFKAKTR